jgi:glycosyltransferase involved in cell wall biosynthesis
MGSPILSVVIPTYNRVDFIVDCVESVLKQTVPVIRTVIVDDGSTDGTWDELTRLYNQNASVRLIHIDNSGRCAARNRGLAEVETEWVAFLDSDDLWEVDKFERDARYLRDDVDMVWGLHYATCDGREVFRRTSFRSNNVWINLVNNYFGHTSANLFRTSAVRAIGGWDEWHEAADEYKLIGDLLMAGSGVAYSSDVTTHVRLVPGSVSDGFPINLRKARIEQDERTMRWLRQVDLIEEYKEYNDKIFLQIRQIYTIDPLYASMKYRSIYALDSEPVFGASSSALYRWVFRWAGFDVAQRVAPLVERARKT